MSANNYMRRKKKKKVSVPVLAADPSTFSRHTEKKKTKKKRSDAWSSLRDNVFFCFCFFLILRAQYLVSVKGNMLQGDMVKKSPCGGSLRRRTAELI